MCFETLVQFSLHFRSISVFVDQCEDGRNTVVRFALELLDFALTFYDESDGYALYATSRESRFHLAPKYWRKLETHQTVENTASLLGIH